MDIDEGNGISSTFIKNNYNPNSKVEEDLDQIKLGRSKT